MPAEGRALTSGVLLTEGGAVIGDEPGNTEKIRELQRKLYRKAKAEPAYRFYLLYDKIYREDILAMPMRWRAPTRARRAWMGRRFEEIEAAGLEGWLAGIRKDLVAQDVSARSRCDG